MSSKAADLAGPGIGNYEELERILPSDYSSALTRRETQKAIEENLCKALNLMMVTVPLIVDVESGVNDYLDRDGSRTPIQFHISNDHNQHPIDAQVVQAATKWKRVALQRFGMQPGEGLCTDMRAVRKDYFLDHDHSAYVDQWDWERAITADQRNLDFLKEIVGKIWKVLVDTERYVQDLFPQLKTKYPNLPEKLTFLHAEDLLDMYPDLPRKQRETAILQECPAIFIVGIGWTLKPTAIRTKCARRITTTGSRPRCRRMAGKCTAEWRHPGLEPCHQAPPRADVHGHPGERQDAAAATGDDRPARFSELSVSSRDPESRTAALDRRRHRSVAHADVAAAQSAPGRGQRHRVAESPERDVRAEEYRGCSRFADTFVLQTKTSKLCPWARRLRQASTDPKLSGERLHQGLDLLPPACNPWLWNRTRSLLLD
jgi:hypothetical protein